MHETRDGSPGDSSRCINPAGTSLHRVRILPTRRSSTERNLGGKLPQFCRLFFL